MQHSPVLVSTTNSTPHFVPDELASAAHSNISPADWNELFHAIEVRLENCIGDDPVKTPELTQEDRLGAIRANVRECITAMQQLQVALDVERQAR